MDSFSTGVLYMFNKPFDTCDSIIMVIYLIICSAVYK